MELPINYNFAQCDINFFQLEIRPLNLFLVLDFLYREFLIEKGIPKEFLSSQFDKNPFEERRIKIKM